MKTREEDPSAEPAASQRPAGPEDADEDQILERLAWAPKERLQYLLDMLGFEERARAARPVREDR